MTVAIAALCGIPDDIMVLAAEDRMVTSGDIEFEQPQPKIWRLGPYAAALFYGSSTAQAEIALRTEVLVRDKQITSIDGIANAYAWVMRGFIRRVAEADILSPLGLTAGDLVQHPPKINRPLLYKLTKQMQLYYEGSGMADDFGGALVIGSDEHGGHIYQVEHGKATYMNRIGFVAGGAGQRHAESQFMFAKYTSHWRFANALSLLYAAKKRAEVTPGVGAETDIIVITTHPPNLLHFPHIHAFVQGLVLLC